MNDVFITKRTDKEDLRISSMASTQNKYIEGVRQQSLNEYDNSSFGQGSQIQHPMESNRSQVTQERTAHLIVENDVMSKDSSLQLTAKAQDNKIIVKEFRRHDVEHIRSRQKEEEETHMTIQDSNLMPDRLEKKHVSIPESECVSLQVTDAQVRKSAITTVHREDQIEPDESSRH